MSAAADNSRKKRRLPVGRQVRFFSIAAGPYAKLQTGGPNEIQDYCYYSLHVLCFIRKPVNSRHKAARGPLFVCPPWRLHIVKERLRIYIQLEYRTCFWCRSWSPLYKPALSLRQGDIFLEERDPLVVHLQFPEWHDYTCVESQRRFSRV